MDDNCQHIQSPKAEIRIIAITDSENPDKIKGHIVELEIFCQECFHPFTFVGVDETLKKSFDNISISSDKTKLFIPIKPI